MSQDWRKNPPSDRWNLPRCIAGRPWGFMKGSGGRLQAYMTQDSRTQVAAMYKGCIGRYRQMSCVNFVFLVWKKQDIMHRIAFVRQIPMSSTPRRGGSIWSQHSEVWHPKLRKCWNLPVGPWLFGCLDHSFFWGEWLSLVLGISKSHLRWWECLSTKRCQRWSMNSLKRLFVIFCVIGPEWTCLELRNESLQNDFLPLSSFLCSFFHIPGVDFSG